MVGLCKIGKTNYCQTMSVIVRPTHDYMNVTMLLANSKFTIPFSFFISFFAYAGAANK